MTARLVGGVLVAVLIATGELIAEEGSRFRPATRSQFGVVVSSSKEASIAGRDALRHGGNAVDAAITTLPAISVTQPGQCGLGGGFDMLWRGPHGEASFLLSGGRTPAASRPDTLGVDPDGIDVAPNAYGHRVVVVPSTVNGAAEALERLGTIPLARAIAPAEKLAREGYTISLLQSQSLAQTAPRLSQFPASAAIFLVNGTDPLPEGATLIQSDLAWTLRQIARFGPKAFSQGVVAKRIIAEMRKPPIAPGDEAILTADDLARDTPLWQEPLRGLYRGHTILSAPPPSAGAIVLETLNVLEGFDLAGAGPSSADALFVQAEAQKIAEVDVASVLTDPRFFRVPVPTLTSKTFASRRRSLIDLQNAQVYTTGVTVPGHGHHGGTGHTTHISVIDRWGNAVSLTCSLSSIFGSAVVAEDTGVLLNNGMRRADPPGHPNQLEGRKLLATAHTPTIVSRHGRLELVVGASGDTAIFRVVPQIIINGVDFGMDIAHAIDAERYLAFQDELGPFVDAEESRIAPHVLAELEARGQFFDFGFGEYGPTGAVGGAAVAGIDPESGERLGAPDPRADGSAKGQ